MNYSEKLQNVSVLGAAGKMGSGIVLLTAIEMADQMLKPENKGKIFVLNAIDISHEALNGLMKYLRVQVLKAAEKNTVALRKTYAHRADLIENSDIIDAYVNDVLMVVRPGTRIEAAYESTLVFEAASENPALKVKLFKQIHENNPQKPWIFTNTSSIPIGNLNKNAALEGKILGFHFYNPPAIQKLVELISIKENPDEMVEFAKQYAKNLRKVVVPSNDIAGFIGNGHFMRDALYGIRQAENQTETMAFHEAVYAVDKVSRDYLARPMGIFQLIDYVGLDVVQFILRVMADYSPGENLHSQLLDELLLKGVKGGQFSDGSQKDGFFIYEKGKPVKVYNITTGEYLAIDTFSAKIDAWLGTTPLAPTPWKNLVKITDKEPLMKPYFAALKNDSSNASKLALAHAVSSGNIARQLVKDGVANNEADVNTVLLTGFFHAYGPINNFLE